MRSNEKSMRDQILEAAVQLFSQYGYHAAPLRDIARMTGIQAASIYHHYPNKQALLVEIMETHMLRLNYGLERILREYNNPSQRLYEAIAHHIGLHTTYKSEFFIVDTELRSLEGKSQSSILSLRDTYANLLQGLLQDGIERGFFRPTDVKVVSYAIIAMCTEVAVWFRPNGRLSVHQVIQIYHQFITEGLVLAPQSAQISDNG